jgi:hypothetical protein
MDSFLGFLAMLFGGVSNYRDSAAAWTNGIPRSNSEPIRTVVFLRGNLPLRWHRLYRYLVPGM